MKFFLTIAIVFCQAVSVLADEPKADNPLLSSRANDVIKNSLRVLSEKDGVVTISLPSRTQSLATKTQIMFFRRKGQRLEVVAHGNVTNESVNSAGVKELSVQIDRDTIIKYPMAGDFAVPLVDPNASPEGEKKDRQDYLAPQDQKPLPENPLPGFIEGAAGLMNGTYATESSTVANNSKHSTGYRFVNLHFAYASHYLPLMIEYDKHGGTFPTGTYYQTKVKSQETVSTLSLGYRFHPLLQGHLFFTLRASLLSDQFTTDNADENLLSTQISGFGIGPRFVYEFKSAVWKPGKRDVFITLQNLFGEFSYYPSLTATDKDISRGTGSSGSSGLQYRIGATALMYFDFIPIAKRFVLQASYGVRSYNLKFAGATQSEVGNPIKIAQGGTSREKESDFRFFIGLRFEDPIKLFIEKGKKK